MTLIDKFIMTFVLILVFNMFTFKFTHTDGGRVQNKIADFSFWAIIASFIALFVLAILRIWI